MTCCGGGYELSRQNRRAGCCRSQTRTSRELIAPMFTMPGRSGVPTRLRIVAGRFTAQHPRVWEPHAGSTLPEHRAQQVAAVSGKRGKRYLQREHLLQLGPPALAYLTELIHRRPRIWVRDVERLHGW